MSAHLFHPKYRPDIDGLRAVAVLSVVIFHAFPSVLQGGFTGVDIFFVISGYLITSIIVNSLYSNSFSFLEFYQRRIRRIFPALATVIAFALGLGWIALLPSEFAQLGKHVLAGAGFISNLVLWNESGYFDNASETKPLLHLWSLGIEEQFYIFFPLILWALWKFHKKLTWALVALILASFSTNLYLSKVDLVADFYAPYTRFWELLLGSMLSIWQRSRPTQAVNKPFDKRKTALAVFGLLLILVGFLTIRSNVNFPGWRALLPTIGAVCLLAAGPNTWINRKVLAQPFLRKIGLISYPLYLWHWVLLVFLRILKGPGVGPKFRLAALLLSVLFAWITYRLIERPLRFGKHAQAKTLGLIFALATLALAGYQIMRLNGAPDRPVALMNLNENSGNDGGAQGFTHPACSKPGIKDFLCFADVREQPRLLLIGDSKSEVLFPGLVRTSTPGNRWAFISQPHFAPLLTNAPAYSNYQDAAQSVLEQALAQNNIDTVVITSATRNMFKLSNETDIQDLPQTMLYDAAYTGLKNFIAQLVAANKYVVLVIDNPTLADPKDCLDRKTSVPALNSLLGLNKPSPNCVITRAEQLRLSERYLTVLQSVAKDFPSKVTVFDTLPQLCDAQTGSCSAHMNNRAMYGYTDHVSDYAAGLVGAALNAELSRKIPNALN